MEDYTEIDHKQLRQGQYESQSIPKKYIFKPVFPDFSSNILFKNGMLNKPIIDKKHMDKNAAKPLWPDRKSFAVCLTHDIDIVTLYSMRRAVRKLSRPPKTGNFFLQRLDDVGSIGMTLLRAAKNIGRKDPLHIFEQWLSLEDEKGAHSTFFFSPGRKMITKPHYSDCMYELDDPVIFEGDKCTVGEMICKIDKRGWEIGLHPSWYSYDNVSEMRRQKKALEEVVGHDLVSVRQHLLHFDIRVTPRVQEEVGFKYDTTLGFNDNVGFRFGTSYPWNIYDLQNNKEMDLLEVPLIIQDNAMLNPRKLLKLDAEKALDYIIKLSGEVEEVGGVLTLLWHNDAVVRDDSWDVYKNALEYLSHRNVWFASVREIGEWWERKAFVGDSGKKE